MDDVHAMQGGSGFGTFCMVAGSAAMAAAGACLTVTDPPFCIVLFLGGLVHLGAGVRARRATYPPASRGSTMVLFIIGLVLELGAVALWK